MRGSKKKVVQMERQRGAIFYNWHRVQLLVVLRKNAFWGPHMGHVALATL